MEELDITIFRIHQPLRYSLITETVLDNRVYSEHLEQKVEMVSREVKGSVRDMEPIIFSLTKIFRTA